MYFYKNAPLTPPPPHIQCINVSIYSIDECFVLVKKMLLTGAMMVVAPGSTSQLLIAILIVLFFMLCVFKLVRCVLFLVSFFSVCLSVCLSL